MYIHENKDWPDFRWDTSKVNPMVEEICRKQGKLVGRLSSLGFDSKLKAMVENLTHDVIYSSEIEGVRLNIEEVRSSIARRVGLDSVKYTTPSHYVDSVVNVMFDAIEKYAEPLTKERLCAWQSALFPTGYSEGVPITIGQYRTHEEHIVSGMFGRERVHYIAPAPDKVEAEMDMFLRWFNAELQENSVVCSAVAHLWFVSIHPFEDGNGRLTRILSDMLLARGEKTEFRFYNVSSQINQNKKQYYHILEQTQRGDCDITEWIVWYLNLILSALDESSATINATLNKSIFWQRVASTPLSERQVHILNLFLDGYEAKITSKTWANLAKCSKDTAIRDIQDLVCKNILCEDMPGAKRPSYSIVYDAEDLTPYFTDVSIVYEGDTAHLKGLYKGIQHVNETILSLDAERFLKGELPLRNLLGKYCAHLLD